MNQVQFIFDVSNATTTGTTIAMMNITNLIQVIFDVLNSTTTITTIAI